MNLLSLALLLVCTPTALLDFAMPKWSTDQALNMEDAYKWIYQATRGGEHAAPDEASARKWLENEWATLGEGDPTEVLWEPLCPGGEVGRFNLRVYRDRRGQPAELIKAFLKSSREYSADETTFVKAWTALGARLREQRYGKLTFAAWSKLEREMKAKQYPALHHSSAYREARRPAYRILTLKDMQRLATK